jgi:hypothetical protein
MGTLRVPDRRIQLFDSSAFLARAGLGKTIVALKKKQIVFPKGRRRKLCFISSAAKSSSA